MSMRIDGASIDAGNKGCATHWRPAGSMSNWSAVLLAALAASLPTHLALGADTTMVLLQPDALQWGDPILPGSPIPAFEKGAKVAVLQGMPGQDGPVVVRLKFPANYVIAPHWHSTASRNCAADCIRCSVHEPAHRSGPR